MPQVSRLRTTDASIMAPPESTRPAVAGDQSSLGKMYEGEAWFDRSIADNERVSIEGDTDSVEREFDAICAALQMSVQHRLPKLNLDYVADCDVTSRDEPINLLVSIGLR